MPWVMIVDSSATIGFFAERASATSGEKSIRSAALIVQMLSSRAAATDRCKIIGNRHSGSMADSSRRPKGRPHSRHREEHRAFIRTLVGLGPEAARNDRSQGKPPHFG